MARASSHSLPEESLIADLVAGRPGRIDPPGREDRFLELCRLHAVSSVVLAELERRGISGKGWENVLRRLGKNRRQVLARNIFLLNRLLAFQATLRKAGVPVLVLKGGSLFSVLYHDLGMRPLSDVDVFIRKSDLGLTLRSLPREEWRIPAEGEVEYYRNHFFHLGIRTNDPFSALFEIHWDLGKEFRQAIEVGEFWERAVRYRYEGEILHRFSNEDLLLHLLIHLANNHYHSPRLIWVFDIREMLHRVPFNWDRLLGRAIRWRLRIPVHYSLRYVEKIFPGTVPPRVLDRVAVDPLRRGILRSVSSADPLLLTPRFDSSFLRWITSLYFIEKPSDILRYLGKHTGPRLRRLEKARQAGEGGDRPGGSAAR